MTQTGVVAGGALTDWVSLGVLASSVPRDVVDDAIAEAGKGAKRARGKLPPHVMVYFVMALALFADDDYEEVAARLTETLRGWGCWEADWEAPTRGGITQARQRLGPEPLAGVFSQVAVPVAGLDTIGAFFGPWRLMSMDGMERDVPETGPNREAFGLRGGCEGPGAYPGIRVVTVSECASHAVVPAAMGPAGGGKGGGEQSLARDLLPRLEENWPLVADRNFYRFRDWRAAAGTGAALPWRVKSDIRLPALEMLPDGSYRSVPVNPKITWNKRKAPLEAAGRGESLDEGQAPIRPRGRVRDPGPRKRRQRRPDRPGHDHHRRPAGPGARAGAGLPPAVGARRRQPAAQDPPARPRPDPAVAVARHGQAGGLGLPADPLRDQRPDLRRRHRSRHRPGPGQVHQDPPDHPPGRRPGFPPDHAAAPRAQITADITKAKNLNPKRRHRTYPRVVKRGRHNSYRIKKPDDHGTRHDGPATIRLANPVELATARST
jgi:hypothetical protein